MTSLTEILAEEDVVPVVPRERPAETEIVTPSGIVIRYDDRKHWYWINGEKVPSVSAILSVLDKPALPWWGMKVGVRGVQKLIRDGHLAIELADTAPVDVVVALLTTHKLTVNHVRDFAADRGTTVHDAFEAWARDGELPDPAAYADDQRGYVTGLTAFLEDARPEPINAETIIGSVEHGYAGRYDLDGDLQECGLVTRCDEKRDIVVRSRVEAGRYLIDLKTSGAVYPEMFLQEEGYEGARLESGHKPTDARAIVRVTSGGQYEFVRSQASFNDFLAVKQAYDAMTALGRRMKAVA